MTILELIEKRRSIRSFKPDSIPHEDLIAIIKAGQMAPSAGDVQGWHFIVITDALIKMKLVDMGAAIFIKNAPFGILVLYDNRTQNIEYMDHIQSASAAIQNILLAAAERNIGSCWVCQLPPKEQIRKLLDIPAHLDPIAYIVLGYHDAPPKLRPRKQVIESVISFNEYSPTENVPLNRLNIALRRFLIRIYFALPVALRKKIYPIIDSKFTKKF